MVSAKKRRVDVSEGMPVSEKQTIAAMVDEAARLNAKLDAAKADFKRKYGQDTKELARLMEVLKDHAKSAAKVRVDGQEFVLQFSPTNGKQVSVKAVYDALMKKKAIAKFLDIVSITQKKLSEAFSKAEISASGLIIETVDDWGSSEFTSK